MFGTLKLDGKCGTRSLLGSRVPLSTLPAAVTKRMPEEFKPLMAFRNVCEKAVPPKLAFRTRMFAPLRPAGADPKIAHLLGVGARVDRVHSCRQNRTRRETSATSG